MSLPCLPCSMYEANDRVFCRTTRAVTRGEELSYYYSDEYDAQLRKLVGMNWSQEYQLGKLSNVPLGGAIVPLSCSQFRSEWRALGPGWKVCCISYYTFYIYSLLNASYDRFFTYILYHIPIYTTCIYTIH